MPDIHWFDILVLVLAIVTFISGYISGVVMQIAMLAGLVLGAIFAGLVAGYIAPKLISWTSIEPHIIGPLSYIIAFAIIIIAILLIAKMIQSMIKAIELNSLNRLAGAIFSTTKWFIAFSILLNIVTEFDQNKKIIKEDVRNESYTYPLVSKIAQTVVPYLKFDWD